jgi:hypothetical protein
MTRECDDRSGGADDGRLARLERVVEDLITADLGRFSLKVAHKQNKQDRWNETAERALGALADGDVETTQVLLPELRACRDAT